MFRHRPSSGDSATRALVAINVGVFILQMLAGSSVGLLIQGFGLTREGLFHGALWQLGTYQFLHGNELHLLVNMLALWFAGRELERAVGTRRFLGLYLAGGAFAGVVQVLFSAGDAPLVGASGSVCAVLLAFTTLFPRLEVTALIFFVLPLRMRAGTLGAGLVALSVLFWLSGWQPAVGHLAHLGGFAAGWAFGLVNRRRFGFGGAELEEPMPAFWRAGGSASEPPPLPGEGTHLRQLRPLSPLDEILAKIQREGIDSLTRAERRVLEESRRRRRGVVGDS